MPTSRFDDDKLLSTVEAVLDAIEAGQPKLAPERHERFAFDVLLNALEGMLESVRERSPADFATFRAAAIASLKDQ